MRIDDAFRAVTGRSLIPWRLQLFAGVSLILLAVAILLEPMLLVLALAGLIGALGVRWTLGGLRRRRIELDNANPRHDFDDYRDYHVH